MEKGINLTPITLFIKKSVLLYTLLSIPCHSLEIEWHGVTCLRISDKNSDLIIDPFVTRPSLWKVLSNQELVSDKELVHKVFSDDQKEMAILISHTHFDHILDLPTLLTKFPKAKVHGPKNTPIFLHSKKMKEAQVSLLQDRKSISHGNFKITSFKIEHSSLPLGLSFARGEQEVNHKGNLGAFDMKSQESYSFYIEHPDGNILFHPSSEDRSYPGIDSVDILLVGLTSRNMEPIKKGLLSQVKAKKVIPVHHENFFNSYDEALSKLPFYPDLGNELTGNLPKTFNLTKNEAIL